MKLPTLVQTTPTTYRLIVLDLIRGVAAILVCASHARAAFLNDYGQLLSPSIFLKAFYFVTGLGHQSVMIFFVLSGFFVGGSILKAGERFSLPQYSIARLTRLWVVLLPSLLITLTIDMILQSFYPGLELGAFDGVLVSWPNHDYSISFITFLGNIFFVQKVLTPVFGSNGPL